MNIDELLNEPFLKLPKDWQKLRYHSYLECVNEEATKYIKLLKNLDEIKLENKQLGLLNKANLISIAKRFQYAVVGSLYSYLDSGNPHNAYNKLSGALTVSNNENIPLANYLEYDDMSIGYDSLYRIRNSEIKLELGGLFHVPFDKRHLINSNRYSIPGYPTLYLSNSVYLAYMELNQPTFNNLYVSRFMYTYDRIKKYLDMTNRPSFNRIDYKYRYLSRWILNMACSIKVAYPSGPFKPEYVLPQLIFQWAKNNKAPGNFEVIGVKYSSTKIDENDKCHHGEFFNLAYPINEIQFRLKYCKELCRIFPLTNPISFIAGMNYKSTKLFNSTVKSIQLNDKAVPYEQTDFAKIEMTLNESPYSKLYYANGGTYPKL